MRFTALHPPPPMPITLMRAPARISSWISYFNESMSSSIASSAFLPQHPAQQAGRLLLLLRMGLELGRVHRQPRHRGPGRIVDLLRPIRDPDRQPLARLRVEDL